MLYIIAPYKTTNILRGITLEISNDFIPELLTINKITLYTVSNTFWCIFLQESNQKQQNCHHRGGSDVHGGFHVECCLPDRC